VGSIPRQAAPCASDCSAVATRVAISAAAASVKVIATTRRNTRSATTSGIASGDSAACERAQPLPSDQTTMRATSAAVFPVPAPASSMRGRSNSL
jgi:hypothetical protein